MPRIALRIAFVSLMLAGCTRKEAAPPQPSAASEMTASSTVSTTAAATSAAAAATDSQEPSLISRFSLSEADVDAFRWVEKHVFASLVNAHVDLSVAKARSEIATAKTFGIEPSNWAKRDIGILVEATRSWEEKKADVEKRLAAAYENRRETENALLRDHSKEVDPGKMAGMFWFGHASDLKPSDIYYPFVSAREAERKLETEREEVYHQFHKETPEERAAGALAMLVVMAMLDDAAGEAGLSAEGEAALAELGGAEAALAVSESEAAATSLLNARSILIASEESGAALTAVDGARTALAGGQIERAATLVADAQAELSATPGLGPGAALALTSASNSIKQLSVSEAVDAEIGRTEKSRIALFEYAATHEGEVSQFLAADRKLARDYLERFRKESSWAARRKESEAEVVDGTWFDRKNGLRWTISDNERDYYWDDADAYCRGLTLSGRAWRLPTLTELSSLFDPESTDTYTVRGPIKLTDCCVWSATKPERCSAMAFYFEDKGGQAANGTCFGGNHRRALCVTE
jgi:hypothetical protein